jgi:aspartate kinase
VIDAVDGDRAVAALGEAFEITSQKIAGEQRAEGRGGDKRDESFTPFSPEQKAEGRRQETQLKIQNPKSKISTTYIPQSIPPVRGVALDLNQARLAIRQVPDRPGMAAKLFGLLAQHNISVDMIIQSQRCRVINGVPTRDIACTVAQIDAQAAKKTLEQAAADLGWGEVVVDSAIAKVSIVGAGMVGQPGVAARMFEALAQHQINIQMIATSEIKISCVVAQEQGVAALQAIHAAFGLAGNQHFQVPA